MGAELLCGPALAAVLLGACVSGFDDFDLVEDAGEDAASTDAGEPDGGGTDGGDVDGAAPDAGGFDGGASDAGTDAGPPDGGPPFEPTRIDVECGETWESLSEPSGACAGREVTELAAPIEPLDLALARAGDGTVTVAYNDLEHFDFGRISTVHFPEDAAAEAEAGTTVEPESAIGEVVGTAMAFATEPPSRHHFVYWLRSDFGHEVRYRTLEDDAFGPVQSPGLEVGRRGTVDVVLDGEGRAVVAWHDDANGEHVTRHQGMDGSFGPAATLRTDGDPRLAGPGAIALASSGDTVSAVYQWAISLDASAPSHNSRVSDGEWSGTNTLDNRTAASRTSGVGVDVARVGNEVVVAYLDWVDGTGEIRLARLAGGATRPAVEVYLSGLRIEDRPGSHPLVLEVDHEGLLHLLVATASTVAGVGPETYLEYHRQTFIGDERRWLVDRVARIAVIPESVAVDMKLGPGRRPHIAFWDPESGKIFYATARP